MVRPDSVKQEREPIWVFLFNTSANFSSNSGLALVQRKILKREIKTTARQSDIVNIFCNF